MTLQAFVDDSGSEPQSPAFVLAGFISSPRRWQSFSDEWAEVLAAPPGAAYFKAAEAMSLRGEFAARRGWTDQSRDERVSQLAEVIWRHATVAISAQLMQSHWEETLQKLAPIFHAVPTKRFSHPYAFLWFTMLKELWLHPTKLALGKGPCDFIFDRQRGFEPETIDIWRAMKAIVDEPPRLPERIAGWMKNEPAFGDDKHFLPLQAADLFAWSNRRAILEAPDRIKLPRAAIDRLCAIPVMHLNITRDHLIVQAHEILGAVRRTFGIPSDLPASQEKG